MSLYESFIIDCMHQITDFVTSFIVTSFIGAILKFIFLYSCSRENQSSKSLTVTFPFKNFVESQKRTDWNQIYFLFLGRCLYKCFVCEWIGSESADFLRHIRKVHEMGYKTYLTKFDNPCILKKMLKCQLCDQVFRIYFNREGLYQKKTYYMKIFL